MKKDPLFKRLSKVAGSLTDQWLKRLRKRARLTVNVLEVIIWTIPRLPFLIRSFRKVRDQVSPGENLLGFLKKLNTHIKRTRSHDYSLSLKNKRIKFFYSGDYVEISKRKKPIIYLAWHHGSGRAEEFAHWADPEAKIFTAYGFHFPNMVRTDSFAFVKMKKILESTGRFLLVFDGEFGRLDLPGKIFGVDGLFSRSYIKLMRQYDVSVIPVTHYLSEDFSVKFYFGPEIFKEDDLSKITDQEILEKIIKYFSDDLLSHDKYQLDYRYLFFPQRLKLLTY